jgi:hypothetical protein
MHCVLENVAEVEQAVSGQREARGCTMEHTSVAADIAIWRVVERAAVGRMGWFVENSPDFHPRHNSC